MNDVRIFLDGDPREWDLSEWSLIDELWQWASEGKHVTLSLPSTALGTLDFGARNSLAALADLAGIAIVVDDSLGETTAGLIAAIGSPHKSILWAVPQSSARVPGNAWGSTEGMGPCVRRIDDRPLPPLSRPALEPAELQARPEGGLIELKLSRQLDGPISDFGVTFWRQVRKTSTSVDDLLRQPSVISRIQYVDRYLKSPLAIRLLYEVLKAVVRERDHNGLPSLEIKTLRLKPDYARSPRLFGHDWDDENTREDVTRSAFSKISSEIRLTRSSSLRELSHARELLVEREDGSSVRLKLDQGFGYWEAQGAPRFPFEADPRVQGKELLKCEIKVRARGKYPTFVYIG